MNLELAHLRAFIAVAERESVTAAATAMHVSQPALSRQIQALESTVGVELLVRSPRGATLSRDGTELLDHAYAVLDAADAFAERARGTASGDVRRITIGATPQSVEQLLAGPLQALADAYPHVSVECVEGTNAELVEHLGTERADVVIAHLPHVVAGNSRRVGSARLHAIVPTRHELAAHDVLDIAQLCAYRLLTMPRGFLTRQLLDGAAAGAGIAPSIALESVNPRSIAAFVGAGLGIGVVSSAGLALVGPLTSIPVDAANRPVEASISIGWVPTRWRSAAVRFLVEQLSQQTLSGYAPE